MRLMQITGPGTPRYVLPEYLKTTPWKPQGHIAEVDGRCGYDLGAGWNPARCGEMIPCPVHADARCVNCGEPATEACCFAGSIAVCGNPLCVQHKGECRAHPR